MKPITIAQRLRPFSTLPGTLIPLPGSSLAVKCYPTKLTFFSLLQEEVEQPLFEVPLEGEGPYEAFTGQLDLEQPSIRFWMTSRHGNYYRYRLFSDLKAREIVLHRERSKHEENEQRFRLPSEETFLSSFPKQLERLALGSHRAQKWDVVYQRSELVEILPIWYQLAQLMPSAEEKLDANVASLLGACQEEFNKGDKQLFWQNMRDLFKIGTEGILSPKKSDDLFWGYSQPILPKENVSRLAFYSVCAPLIRDSIVRLEGEQLKFLDLVPEELHCGKMTGITLPEIGHLDFEWSKKRLRRVLLRTTHDCELRLFFGKGVEKLRMRSFYLGKEQERLFDRFTMGFKQGGLYCLDRFEE